MRVHGPRCIVVPGFRSMLNPGYKLVGGQNGRTEQPAVMTILGIPVDFILFGLTLLGVALFHRHTLAIALAGLAVITAYKLAFTGFKTGAGLAGLALPLEHERVILDPLFLMLRGLTII